MKILGFEIKWVGFKTSIEVQIKQAYFNGTNRRDIVGAIKKYRELVPGAHLMDAKKRVEEIVGYNI